MALYYNIPVYKASYTLVKMLFAYSENFAREYKYTVGQDLKNEGSMLIKNIYRANKIQDKSVPIADARENVEMIRLFVRLMQDFGQIGLKKFVELNLCIEEVSKQLAAWEKYSAGRSSSDNAGSAPRPGSGPDLGDVRGSGAGKARPSGSAGSAKGGSGKGMETPPESSVARAQASERSISNSPLAQNVGEEYHLSLKTREALEVQEGYVGRFHQKDCLTNEEAMCPLAGNRDRTTAALNNVGSNGNYWSSTVSGTNAVNLNFNASTVNPANVNNRGNGLTVRCVKDMQTTTVC